METALWLHLTVNIKMAPIAAHLNAGVILVATMQSLYRPPLPHLLGGEFVLYFVMHM